MSSRLLLRGGTAATVGAITPASRELLVNTDTDRVHVGDGTTPGGNPLALLSDVTSSSGTTNLSGSGTASVYTVASDTGTDATIPAATNAAAGVATAAHITELEAIRTILGGVAGGTDLGAFTGSTLSDSSVLRTVLQEVETELEAIRTSQGIAGAAADLGTFTGSIVSDNTTVKNAIQEIETDVDAIQTLTGVAAEATDLGTFTGDVITDNVTIAAAAQELETAIIKNRFVQGTEATAMDNTQNYIIAASGTVTLPASPFTGQRVWVYDATGAANTTNIAVNNSAAVLQTNLDQNSQFKAFVWNGSAWVILWDSKAHLPQKHLHVATSATLQNGQNYIIFADTAAASADIVITLPVTPVANQSIWLYDQTDNATTWNVLTGSDIRLYSDGASVHLVYDGAAWQTVFDSQDLEQKSISSKVGTGPGYYIRSSPVEYIENAGFWNNIGTQDFTIVAEFTPNSTVWQVIANSAGTEAMLSSAQLLIGDLTIYPIPSYTFVVGQKYVLCLSADRDGNASYYVNGKLVGLIDISAEAANALAGNLRAFRGSVSASQTAHSLKIYNRALTATEIEQVSNGQNLGFADYGASGAASYTSDFSAGVDGWTALLGAVNGNIDGIGGKDNVLRFTSNTATGTHLATKLTTFTAGKRYRVSGSYFIPSGQSNIDGIYIYPENNGSVVIVYNASPALNQWNAFDVEIVVGVSGSNIQVRPQDGGSSVFTDSGGDDVFYLSDIVITPIGLVLDWNENGIGEDTWADASGNAYDGTVTGATAINIPKYEEINTNYVKLTDLIWIGIDGGVLSKTNDAGSTWTAI